MGLFRRRKLNKTAICSAIVVAAGNSSRMGQDKILADLGGVPVIIHSLRTLDAMEEIGEIIVVTREDLIPRIASLCREHRLNKVKKVVCGGASRAESSRLGTLEVNADAQLIAIHDGARPLVTETVIHDAVLRAAETGAAAPAIPVKDTIKLADHGVAEKTLDRSQLYAVQTPQVFEASLIRAALQKALDDGADVTDDCSVVERLGMKVSLTAGSERNLKLTTPMDLLWAECLLNEGVVR